MEPEGPSASGVRAIVTGPGTDNVATAVTALEAGERLRIDGQDVVVAEPIPTGHKLALQAVAAGAAIVKYRETIGRAAAPIAAGAHVHVHNVVSARLPGPGAGTQGA